MFSYAYLKILTINPTKACKVQNDKAIPVLTKKMVICFTFHFNSQFVVQLFERHTH